MSASGVSILLWIPEVSQPCRELFFDMKASKKLVRLIYWHFMMQHKPFEDGLESYKHCKYQYKDTKVIDLSVMELHR